LGLFKSADGTVVSVPDDQAGSAAAQGLTPIEPGQGGVAVPKQEDAGALGAVGTALTSAASGATLGASDILLSGLLTKERSRQVLAEREAHPWIAGAASAAGAIVPALAAPGSALSFTPAGATSAVGRGVVESVAPEGAGLIRRTVGGSLGGAAEGAAFAGGQYLAETALADKEASAEGFMGAAGHGALFGGALGGGFTLGEAALIKAKSLFPHHEVNAEAAKGVQQEASVGVSQAIADGDQMAEIARQKLAQAKADIGVAESAVAPVGTQVARKAFESPAESTTVDRTAFQQEAGSKLNGQYPSQWKPDFEAELRAPDERPLPPEPGLTPYQQDMIAAKAKFDAARKAVELPPEMADLERSLLDLENKKELLLDWLHGSNDVALEASLRNLAPGDIQRIPVPQGEFARPGKGGIKTPQELEQMVADAAKPEAPATAKLRGPSTEEPTAVLRGQPNAQIQQLLTDPATAAGRRRPTLDEPTAAGRKRPADLTSSGGDSGLAQLIRMQREAGEPETGIEGLLRMQADASAPETGLENLLRMQSEASAPETGLEGLLRMQRDAGKGRAPREISGLERQLQLQRKASAEPSDGPVPGFSLNKTETSEPLFNDNPTLREGIPTRRQAKRGDYRDTAYIVKPSELAAREVRGVTADEAATAARVSSVRKAWDSGETLPAVEVDIDKSGNYFVLAGNKRLLAAAQDGDRPVLVRFRPVEHPVRGMDDLASDLRGPRAAELAPAVAPEDLSLEALLRGTKSAVDSGADIGALGRSSPARDRYIADKAVTRAQQTEHYRAKANEKNFAASEMGASERAANERPPAPEKRGSLDDLRNLIGDMGWSTPGTRAARIRVSDTENPIPFVEDKIPRRMETWKAKEEAKVGRRQLREAARTARNNELLLKKLAKFGKDVEPAAARAGMPNPRPLKREVATATSRAPRAAGMRAPRPPAVIPPVPGVAATTAAAAPSIAANPQPLTPSDRAQMADNLSEPAAAALADVGQVTSVGRKLREDVALSARDERLVETIDDALTRSPAPHDVEVYRSADVDYSHIKPGDTVVDEGYLTASTEKPGTGRTQLHVTVPEGSPMAPVGSVEVILPRGTSFRVDSIAETPSTRVLKVTAHPPEEFAAAVENGQKTMVDRLSEVLSTSKEPVTPAAVAKHLEVSEPQAKQIVDELQSRGLIGEARQPPRSEFAASADVTAPRSLSDTLTDGGRALSRSEEDALISAALKRHGLDGEPLPVRPVDPIADRLTANRKAAEAQIGKHVGKDVDMGTALAHAAKVINDYEAAAANLTGKLGPQAPASARARADGYHAATAKQGEAQAASSAKAAADVNNKLAPKLNVVTGGRAGSALNAAMDLGTGLEVLKAMGVHVPGLSAIPVIGPVLSLFLKARAVMGILKRKGGGVLRSSEGVVAAKSVETRNRINAATRALLDRGARGAAKASTIAAPPAAILAHKLFPGGADPKTKDLPTLYHARIDELSRALVPGAIEAAVADSVPTSNPELQDAIAAQARKGLEFIASKAPRPGTSPGMMSPDGVWKPNKASLDVWSKYVAAVANPAAVLEDLASGHVSREGAEVLRTVYPKLFGEAQRTLMELMPTFQKTMPYPRRVAMSIMFGVPVDGSMQQSHLQFIAGPPAAPALPLGAQPPPMQTGPALTGPLKTSTLTSLDRRAGA
jgi:predicted ArsR family transcriptional regulator